MGLTDLTPEQQEAFKTCETPEELVELAKESGFELTDEELEDLAGGTPAATGTSPCRTKILDKPGKKFKKSSYLENQQAQPEPAGE